MTQQRIKPLWQRFLSAIAMLLMVLGMIPLSVQAADQTLTGSEVEGNLQIMVKDTGAMGVWRYISGTWQGQFFSGTAKGSRLYFNGSAYSLSDGSGWQMDGTAPTLVSNTLNGNTITTVWNAGSDFVITQTTTYNDGNSYYRLEWEITNVSGSSISDLRFFHGGDTYLQGGDSGAGWWDAVNTTIGVQKDVGGALQRMYLQGATPYAYDSLRYSTVSTNANNGALTDTVDDNESTDNGYALEWREASLADGATWKILADERFTSSASGSVSVTAPISTDCDAGTSCDVTYQVSNLDASDIEVDFSATDDQPTWNATITSHTNPVTVPANNSISVVVQVSPPAGTADGTTGNFTLTATPTAAGDAASDTAAVQVIGAANTPPSADTVTVLDVTSAEAGLTSHSFTIQYSDDTGIDVSTIDEADVTVTGCTVTSGTEATGANGTPKTATYTLTPPGGDWDAGDNGDYTIALIANEVGDDGTPQYFVAENPFIATFKVDLTAPAVTINQSSTQADPTNSPPVSFTVIFTEPVTGFDASDVDLSASTAPGTLTAAVSGTGPYTVTVSGMTGDGDVIASVLAGAAQDAVGNSNSASTSADNTVAYDSTAPTVTVEQATSQTDPTNTSPVSFTVTFSEPVTGFDDADVDLSASTAPGTLAAAVSGTGPYTVTVSGMTGDGDIIASVIADAAQDGVGNNSLASASTDNVVTYIYDSIPPSVTVEQATSQTDPTNASPVSFTITFSEPVTGFEAADVDLSASTAPGTLTAAVSGTGPYTVTVRGMTGDGDVVASVGANAAQDAAGNDSDASTSADNTVAYDATAPTVTVEQATAQPDPTNASPINFTVTFSEPVTGFEAADVDLSASTAPGTLTAAVSGTGPYTVTVDGMTGDGDVVASVGANAAQDAAGNNSGASTSTDNTVAYDATAPTVTVEQATAQPDPTNASPVTFTVTFSEPVTGFVVADVDLSASTAPGTLTAAVSGTGPYTVTVSGMTGDGNVVASVGANAAQDAAGNDSDASTSADNTVAYDATAPTVTVEQATAQPDPTNASPINFTVTFSEPVTGFEAADVDLSASTAPGTLTAAVSGTGPYTVTVDGMTGDGDVVASVGANAAQDAAGNNNEASTSADNTVAYDATAPTVTVEQAETQTDPANTLPIVFTVTFSESVTGFETADLDFSGTTAPGTLTANVSGSGTTYTVEVSGMTYDGDVKASVIENAAQDAAGNDSAGSTSTDNTVFYDLIDLVINEIDVDQGEVDTAEFIEIKNIGESDVNLGEYILELNGGAPEVYQIVALNNVMLAPGDYYVLCDTLSSLPNCDQAIRLGDDFIQDNMPDALLLTKGNRKVDMISYGGDTAEYTETSGATADSATEPFVSISRYPDGTDTDDNSVDFSLRCATPGMANNLSDSSGCFAITVEDATATEGDAGTVDMDFTVTLSPASDFTATVNYALTHGTATAGDDYTPVSGTLTFEPGETEKTVTVSVAGDALDEDDETVVLNLTEPSNATLAVAQGTGTIEDNDGEPSLSINNAEVVEGDLGTVDAAFAVVLSPVSGRTVTVEYAASDGTAEAEGDYSAVSGTLTFAPGETEKPIIVNIYGETEAEADEGFNVSLSDPVNALLDDAQGVGTILDDDSDADGDGMPDRWETANGLDPEDPSDAASDIDNDGFPNLAEHVNGTDPTLADTDGDGVNDGDEWNNGTDPLDAAMKSPEEAADSDGDGVPDWYENRAGMDPADPADAAVDPDGDGLVNIEEYVLATDISDPDTDNDGDADGAEADAGSDPLDRASTLTTDTDGDGLPDYWENRHGLDPENPDDAAADSDGDGRDNHVEFNQGTDPAKGDSPDTDGDGLPDWWETRHGFDPENPDDAAMDPDNDGRDNRTEFGEETDPGVADSPDSDGDGMPDYWETGHGLDPHSALDAKTDPDKDGRNNLTEFNEDTDPSVSDSPDSDEDGMPDWWEAKHGFDPDNAADAAGDPDGDGRGNRTEFDDKSDPNRADMPDRDDDGMADPWEMENGLSPDDPSDVGGDPDGDGLKNLSEFVNGTDPNRADTDGDGVADGDELANGTDPLDKDVAAPEDAPDSDGDAIPDWIEEREGSDPNDAADGEKDNDNDGLTNAEEYAANTDPDNGDSDKDGFTDGEEVEAGASPMDPSDSLTADADGDGLPDYWEKKHGLDPADASDAALDPDADGRNNRTEFNENTDPNVSDNPDSDGDGLPDWWEKDNGLDPDDAADAADDSDGDGRDNRVEFNDGSDPKAPDSPDSDGDGMPDYWETVNGLDPGDPDDASADADGDGLNNLVEFNQGSNPTTSEIPAAIRDDDADGMDDDWESRRGLNPLDPADAGLDADGDGIDNLNEFIQGTRPDNPDSDGDGATDGEEWLNRTDPADRSVSDPSDADADGMPDWWEKRWGLDPADPNDATADADGDGVSNLSEFILGTSPKTADSDGDGETDGEELIFGADPMDPRTTSADPVKDRDADGLPDWWEAVHDIIALYGDADPDGDGLSNAGEWAAGADPRNADTDGDGVSDGDEVARGEDPLAPAHAGPTDAAPAPCEDCDGLDCDGSGGRCFITTPAGTGSAAGALLLLVLGAACALPALAARRNILIKALIKAWFPCLAAALLLAPSVRAGDLPYYAGVYGFYAFENLDEDHARDCFDNPAPVSFDDAAGVQLRAGMRLNRAVSLESVFEYVFPFESGDDGFGAETDAIQAAVQVKAAYPGFESFRPYAALGLGVMNAETEATFRGRSCTQNHTGASLRFGLGAEIDLSRALFLDLEGAYTQGMGGVSHVGFTGLTFGIGYRF